MTHTSTKTQYDPKAVISTAKELLTEYMRDFGVWSITGTLELDGFEAKQNGHYEIIFSYYAPNSALKTLKSPNIKKYKKIILDKDYNLIKISSQI